jgi:hydroxymethylpyrimidine kinase/phosphomethylpyrimidine kinase/thiamine-phosphate diphosphorylase
MTKHSIGLYPVIDNISWLETLLPLGIEHIQLRIKKNNNSQDLEKEIKNSILLAQKYNAKLYINDHWELAIKYSAYGIHLGQEDLDVANRDVIISANLKLGISAYSDQELARALEYKPSYIAFGPIFETVSKVMSVDAQGLEKLAEWRRKISCP